MSSSILSAQFHLQCPVMRRDSSNNYYRLSWSWNDRHYMVNSCRVSSCFPSLNSTPICPRLETREMCLSEGADGSWTWSWCEERGLNPPGLVKKSWTNLGALKIHYLGKKNSTFCRLQVEISGYTRISEQTHLRKPQQKSLPTQIGFVKFCQ